jgi:hypothetical protein
LSFGALIRSSYLLYFSQPATDRVLFKAMKGRPIHSIVELGIGLGGRTERLLEVARWGTRGRQLKYAGIDLFESRVQSRPRLSLKKAFHALRATGASIRLLPGDPYSVLSRMANALTGTDLLLIAADQDRESIAACWRFVPRMIHPQTLVFVQESGGPGKVLWRQLRQDEVLRLAGQASRALRRAA